MSDSVHDCQLFSQAFESWMRLAIVRAPPAASDSGLCLYTTLSLYIPVSDIIN